MMNAVQHIPNHSVIVHHLLINKRLLLTHLQGVHGSPCSPPSLCGEWNAPCCRSPSTVCHKTFSRMAPHQLATNPSMFFLMCDAFATGTCGQHKLVRRGDRHGCWLTHGPSFSLHHVNNHSGEVLSQLKKSSFMLWRSESSGLKAHHPANFT